MKELLQRVSGARILVVGDLMIDTYLWGEVERISPEAPVPVVHITREEARLGGAANVAHNLAVLGCQAIVCGLVGADSLGRRLREMLAAAGVSPDGVVEDSTRPTTEKTRVMAQSQQLIRFDREKCHHPAPPAAQAVSQWLRQNLGACDGVIVSDYGKGLITPEVMALLAQPCRERGISLLVDPKGSDYGKYRGVDCITPNQQEAARAAGLAISSESSAAAAGRHLMEQLGLSRICITRGAQGVLAMEDAAQHLLPARAREVFDVSGAGDTFISVLGAAWFTGSSFFDAVAAANLAAGVSVGKLGTATVTVPEILGALETPPRLHSGAEITTVAETLRAAGRRIVFTNGCFDLLHAGHVQYLQASRALGDALIVGINSDASVRRLKGEGRPVIGQDDRAHLLGALACVDHVVVFGEDEPLELIRAIRPDVLTKGADYTIETVVGHDLVSQWGGEVRLIPLTENRSTSGLIEKISNNRKK